MCFAFFGWLFSEADVAAGGELTYSECRRELCLLVTGKQLYKRKISHTSATTHTSDSHDVDNCVCRLPNEARGIIYYPSRQQAWAAGTVGP